MATLEQFVSLTAIGWMLVVSAAFVTIMSGIAAWQALTTRILRRWRARVRLPKVAAYVAEPSIAIGQRLDVCVHTSRPAVVTLSRMGVELERVWSGPIAAIGQSNRYDFWKGLDWPSTVSIPTDEFTSGLYLLEVQQTNADERFRTAVILTPNKPVDVAVVCATNTWQAYNDFAGFSNYEDSATPRPFRWVRKLMEWLNLQVCIGSRHFIPSTPLPYARPNVRLNDELQELDQPATETYSRFARAEWELLKTLEEHGTNYGVFSDHDFANVSHATQAKLVIFAAHSEYWSEEMIGRMHAFRSKGGNVAFFSGNNLYRRVRSLNGGIVVTGMQTSGPDLAAMLGNGYDATGFNTYAGYSVTEAHHWIFDGLEVGDGTVFGEDDRHRIANGWSFGASGYETDKLMSTSRNVTVLAIGRNVEGPSYMTLKDDNDGSGWLFTTGSVSSCSWCHHDRVLAGITRNLVKAALESGQHLPRLSGAA